VGSTGDFIIEAPPQAPGLVNVAGIDSPGLTASPAIASYVAELLAERGLKLLPRPGYDPVRKGISRFASLPPEVQGRLIAADPRYGRIVCRCEMVSEGEIVGSIHRPLGARTPDAVKRRTRAGMGRCQSGLCHIEIAFILARELGVSPLDILNQESNAFSGIAGMRLDGHI
jgi:glycerol-3-phosphate dehydrogenase